MKQVKNRIQGFTLIELLIVIAVMAILMAVVFVALNPLGRFADARNSRRWTDVNAIISAIKLQQVDNSGQYLAAIREETAMASNTPYMIGTAASGCNVTCSLPASAGGGTAIAQAGCIDLTDLVTRGYLARVPVDPTGGDYTDNSTGYFIVKRPNGTLIIGACGEEAGSTAAAPDISVVR
jgi:prepilin-type N-terminal cleavage/methylation domain-containing protein